MAIVTVNDNDVEVGDGEQLNLIQAARRAGVEIPHYCWHSALSVVASCRMCLVEIGERKPNGVVMQPKLVPACQTPAKEGTVVVTNSTKVKQAQAATLEYLLLNHPLDCPTCDQAGECFLQDYSFRYGRPQSRLQEPKVVRPDKNYIGDQITLFTDRCVMCTRCVRFTREITGTAELQVIQRGAHAEIDIFPGHPCNNKLAGNVVDLCPVGALCSKDFLYKQRVWWLRSTQSVCSGCSTGCSIYVDQNEDRVYRLRPRSNPLAQGDFICDDGRFGFHYIHGPERLLEPVMKIPGSERNGDDRVPVEWDFILSAVRNEITEQAAADGSRVLVVFSPFMTCEEAYLLASWLKSVSTAIRLAMGPIPVVGEDDTYPKNVHGEPLQPAKFTIRAEKCPNRRGVEAVLAHYEPGFAQFHETFEAMTDGQFALIYLIGGYPSNWLAEAVAALSNVRTIILQDLLRSEISDRAQYVLAGASFAEREGIWVNHAGLAQKLQWAIRPPGSAWPDGRILMQLTGRVGLFHAGSIRREMAEAIPFFRPLASGKLGDLGTQLQNSEG